jgi:hypothetical protein
MTKKNLSDELNKLINLIQLVRLVFPKRKEIAIKKEIKIKEN